MSQLLNIVTTEFRARGGSQVTATMGSYAAGMGRIGQSLNEVTRMSEKFGQTWRAVGTTVRYAIAGSLVFGLKGVVDQLKEIQQQMGLISAIGTTQGGQAIVGQGLTNLMAQARQGAVESITPLQDFNNSIINILSTVQDVPENKIVPIATEISKAAKLAQINAEDATKAFTTMNVAFGRPVNLQNIHKMAQEFFILTKEAPGGAAAGQQIITQLGQLAAVTKAGGGTPEDIFSLYLSGLRGGIPPAQLGRGLQYMIQTIALPGSQSKKSRAALGSVGIVPGANLTLQQRISKVLGKARNLGLGGNLSGLATMDEETLGQFDALGDTGTSAAFQAMGISGKGAEFLGQVFPRIHALRAALAIQTQLDSGKAQADFKLIEQARDGHVKDVDSLAKAWKRFSDQAKLQAATVAISAMGQQVATVFAPVLNYAAQGVVDTSKFLSVHAKGTSRGVVGATGLMALIAASRFTGVGPRSLGKGAVGAQAGLAFATGGGGQTVMDGLGNSPGNSLYVTVVNDLFRNAPGVPGAPGIPGGGGRPRGRLGTAARLIGGTLAAVGATYVADKAAEDIDKKVKAHGWGHFFLGGAAGPVGAFGHKITTPFGGKDPAEKMRDKALMQRAEEVYNKYHPGSPVHITELFKAAFGKLHGKAYVTMDVNLKYPDGKSQREKVHIPLDLISKTGAPPSSKGNSGNRSR